MVFNLQSWTDPGINLWLISYLHFHYFEIVIPLSVKFWCKFEFLTSLQLKKAGHYFSYAPVHEHISHVLKEIYKWNFDEIWKKKLHTLKNKPNLIKNRILTKNLTHLSIWTWNPQSAIFTNVSKSSFDSVVIWPWLGWTFSTITAS